MPGEEEEEEDGGQSGERLPEARLPRRNGVSDRAKTCNRGPQGPWTNGLPRPAGAPTGAEGSRWELAGPRPCSFQVPEAEVGGNHSKALGRPPGGTGDGSATPFVLVGGEEELRYGRSHPWRAWHTAQVSQAARPVPPPPGGPSCRPDGSPDTDAKTPNQWRGGNDGGPRWGPPGRAWAPASSHPGVVGGGQNLLEPEKGCELRLRSTKYVNEETERFGCAGRHPWAPRSVPTHRVGVGAQHAGGPSGRGLVFAGLTP